MALPTVLFNNGTGSDTAASGAGPGTALFGTGAATTAASNVLSLLTDNPSLSGVATDGSGLAWVLSSSGIQFNKITGVDDTAGVKTVTCAVNWANTEGSRTWGIGGKRKTIGNTQSRLLFSTDIKPGWTVTLEDDQPAVTTSVACTVGGDTTTGYITLQGDSTTTRRLLTSATNNISPLSGGLSGWVVKNLKFTSTAATKTSSYGILFNASSTLMTILDNCVLGDATNKLQSGIERTATSNGGLTLRDCEITTTLGKGIGDWSGTSGGGFEAINCYIHDCAGGGIVPTLLTLAAGFIVQNCIIVSNTGIGVSVPNAGGRQNTVISGNVIAENSSDGVKFTNALSAVSAHVFNNQIIHNGGFGVNIAGGTVAINDTTGGLFDYNNFGTGSSSWIGENTSGQYSNKTAGAHDLAVDPQFTNPGSGDFSIGTNTKAAGYPDDTRNIGANNSATLTYVDIGAAQRQESSGGGGLIRHPGMRGGLNA